MYVRVPKGTEIILVMFGSTTGTRVPPSWRKIGPDRADPDPAHQAGYGYIDFSESMLQL